MPEPEPLILSIETATSACSVALIRDGYIIGSESVDIWQRHNEVLPLIVERLLKACESSYPEINAVAVSIGPGSFTGLRVGLSFAKGIAVGAGIGVIPVNTLDALALTISSEKGNGSFLPMVTARRDEVFGCLYEKVDNDNFPAAKGDVFMGGIEKVVGISGNQIQLCGPGCDALGESLSQQIPGNMSIINGVTAQADSVGLIGYRKWTTNPKEFSDFQDLEPQYLKEFTVKTKKSQ
jgi:tRNA threonylcarbamoyladenosine biosynthesis protein TsaB